MKYFNIVILFILVLAGCKQAPDIPTRPIEAWVFRSVMDEKPRIVTAALSDELWVSYDAQRASLYKAWKGGVHFDGAVYTTVHGPQPTSWGYAYYKDEDQKDMEWFLIKDGQVTTPKLNYKGHRVRNGQVTFRYELIAEDGEVVTVTECPEVLRRGTQNGLQRTFEVTNAGDYQVGLNLTISSLADERDIYSDGRYEIVSRGQVQYEAGSVQKVSGKLMLDREKPTDLRVFYHQGFEIDESKSSENEDQLLNGARLIEKSDCKSCHNEQVKTVGPSYISVARKYADTDESITLLVSKIIKGGNGIWGEAMMTPHPALSETDAHEMVSYILSLDDAEKLSGADEKTVPFGLKETLKIEETSPGLAVYEYLYSGDMPNFDVLKKDGSPVKAAVVSKLHAIQAVDMSKRGANFAILGKGNLKIPKEGSYSFRLISDDGARLFIDGKKIIDHWGSHGISPKDGEMYLKAGNHKIEVQYFQGGGGGALSLQWFNLESGTFEPVPESMLFVSPDDYLAITPYVDEKELVKSIPGDRQWLNKVHPAFDLFQARPGSFQPRVGGIDFLTEDEMLVCTWDSLGPVYLVENFRDKNPQNIKVTRIATGLAEPLGLKVVDGEIYVLQKQELTRLIDHDGDRIIDEYETICDDWRVSANFHEFAFGLAYKDGYFYGALATAILPGGASAQPQIPDRGKVVKISKEDGSLEFVAHGLRTPNGIGIGVDNEVFVADNQGDWLPASKINHVKKGAFYGSRSVDFEGTEGLELTYPVVWLTQDEIGNSPSTPLYLDKGPYAGQMIHCEVTHGGIKRVFVEKVGGNYQGAVFRFSQGLEAGINRMQWAPDGSLVVGGIGVSGNWGQTGKLGYGLQRLVYNGKSAFEMLKISARSDGFEIEFTEPIDEGQYLSAEDFLIQQYYFKPTSQYGGPKLGLETLTPKSFHLSDDRKKVFFELGGLKEKHVVYFRIKRPFVSANDQELWTTEAWYTLNAIPENQPGFTSDYQVKFNTLSEEEEAEGWKLLFDGKSTKGIRNYRGQKLGSSWQVQDGALHFSGKTKGNASQGGDIVITDKPYENYELRLDWKIVKGGNSGIIYQVVEDEAHEYPWQTGLEMQVLDNLRHSDGQIEKHRAGDLYDLIASKFVAVNPAGEWNRVRLIIKDGKLEQWLNGYRVVTADLRAPEWQDLVGKSKFADMADFGKAKKGHVVLQDHGDKVWFRNIKIKEL